MAIIDLTIDRPSFKRVEYTGDITDEEMAAKATEAKAAKMDEMLEMDEEMTMETEDATESSSRGGMFSMRRLLVLAVVGTAVAFGVRRIRGRMSADVEMETPIDVETPAEATAE